MRRTLQIIALALLLSTVSSFVSFSKNVSEESVLSKEEEKFNIAVKAFSDDFYDASLSLFKKFTGDFPKSALFYEAKLYIAKCCYYREDHRKALEVFSEIEKNGKKEDIVGEAYYWLSVIYFSENDFDQALKYSQRIIDNYPNFKFIWEAYYLIGSCNLELGKIDKGEETFSKIISECSQEEIVSNAYFQILSVYLQNKKYDQIISLGEGYVKNFPKGILNAKVYYYLGESYYVKGEWGKALDNYRKALKGIRDLELKDLIYQGLGFTYIEKADKIKAKSNIDKIKNRELRLFSQGVYYFKSEERIQTLETVNIFIRDYPESNFLLEIYLIKADLLYEMGRLNDSISVYRYLLDNFEGSQYTENINKAHYGLAWCYLKNGKFKKAIDEFKNTLKHTNNPVVKVSSQIQIADAYQETGKYIEALDIYNLILKNQPNTVYADYVQFQVGMCFLKKKDLEKAFLALKNLKNNFPFSKLIPQVQYYLAVGYFSREDYAQAKSLLDDFIDKFSQDLLISKVYYLYGKCFFNEKNYQEALSIFRKIVGKFKDQEIAQLVYIDMGNAYLNLLLFDKAKKVWKDFLAQYPQSQYGASVTLYLGGICEKEENYIEAEEYYKKAISDYKNSSSADEALLSLGHLYWNRGNLEKAQNYFQRLSKRQTPLALKGKLYLAKILFQRGKSQDALKLYDQLIKVNSSISKIALREKAFLLKDIKDYRQAITVFKKAIKQNIDNSELRFTLGLCLEKIDKGGDAIEEYLKAIYLFFNQEASQRNNIVKYNVKAYFRIARIYEKMGEKEEAKKAYKKIISLGVGEASIAEARLRDLE